MNSVEIEEAVAALTPEAFEVAEFRSFHSPSYRLRQTARMISGAVVSHRRARDQD